MKHFLLIIISILTIFISTNSIAFISFGNITSTLDYKNFRQQDDGYTFTLVNKSTNEISEFYVIIRGYDYRKNTIYRKRIYVDFLEGNGELTFFLPGYDERIFEVDIKTEKRMQLDVRIVK
jgi:hypothetical protein